MAHAMQAYFANLAAQGSTTPWKDRMLDFDGLNQVIGTPALLEQGRRYEGVDSSSTQQVTVGEASNGGGRIG